jgi:CheY-like chemotaxis protein
MLNAGVRRRGVVPTILCVDDQSAGLGIRRQLLESKGYDVLTATDGLRALDLARQHNVDLVILDFRMPEMDGERLTAILKAENPARPVVLLSGYPGDIPARLMSMVDGFVEKGNSAAVLLAAVEKALNTSRRRPARQQSGRYKRDSA